MEIIAALVALIVGAGGGLMLGKKNSEGQLKSKRDELDKEADRLLKQSRESADRIKKEAEDTAKRSMKEAELENERIKKMKIVEAKERYVKMKSKFESDTASRRQEIKEEELKLKQKENSIKGKLDSANNKLQEAERKSEEIGAIKENLMKQLEIVAKKKENLEKANEKHVQALEKVAKLSEQEAREELMKAIKDKAETQAMAYVKDRIDEAKQTANKEAKKIIIQSIQRMAAEQTIENTVSVFNLTSDDLKGQIIGREGRNIRALEAATGAEIIVDDTPLLVSKKWSRKRENNSKSRSWKLVNAV